MQNPSLSRRKLLISYVRELKDVKAKQVRLYTQWTDHDYSDQFNRFLSEQKEQISRQHVALKALIDNWRGGISQKPNDIVIGLLHEAEQIDRYCREKNELISVEPVLVQVLHGIIYHEIVIIRGALTLARTLREPTIVTTLVNILEEQEQAYLQLRDFKEEKVGNNHNIYR